MVELATRLVTPAAMALLEAGQQGAISASARVSKSRPWLQIDAGSVAKDEAVRLS